MGPQGAAGDRVPLLVHIVVDHRDQLVQSGRARRGQDVRHAFLPRQSMGDIGGDGGARILDQPTVAGGDDIDGRLQLCHPGQTGQVHAHVPVGGCDDHRRPVHDMVAGEEHGRARPRGVGGGQVDPVAEVVRGMPGGVDGPEGQARAPELKAVGDGPVGREPVTGGIAQARRSGSVSQAGCPRSVVGVGMGHEDPADPSTAGVRHSIEVGGIVWSRIDDGELVGAQQVCVGAGTGHHAGVGRGDAHHPRCHRLGLFVDQRGGLRRLSRHRPPWPPLRPHSRRPRDAGP